MQMAAQTDQLPMVQEVSSAMHIQGNKTGDLERSCTNTNSNSNCCTNKNSNSNLNSSNTFMPIVNNNEMEYFLPDPNQENYRKSQDGYKEILKMFLVE